jgi:hypothetical protein
VDRRIALIAAGLEDREMSSDYVADVLTGPRPNHIDRNMALDYARFACEIHGMKIEEVVSRYALPLAEPLLAFSGAARKTAAVQYVEMMMRHADSVHGVLQSALVQHSADVLDGEIASDSLIALLTQGLHRSPRWKRCAERLASILQEAVPTSCKDNPPRNENHLRDICEAILKGHRPKLDSEFPALKWALAQAKPDLSSGECQLFIELKYVRDTTTPAKVTGEIAEDITKYTDNNRRVLFLIYDPTRLVVNDTELVEQIVRPGVLARIIR